MSLPSWPLRVTVQPLHLLLSRDAFHSQIFQGHTKHSLSRIFGQLHLLIRAGSGCYLSVQGAHLRHFRQTPDLCCRCLGQGSVCDCDSFNYCLCRIMQKPHFLVYAEMLTILTEVDRDQILLKEIFNCDFQIQAISEVRMRLWHHTGPTLILELDLNRWKLNVLIVSS